MSTVVFAVGDVVPETAEPRAKQAATDPDPSVQQAGKDALGAVETVRKYERLYKPKNL